MALSFVVLVGCTRKVAPQGKKVPEKLSYTKENMRRLVFHLKEKLEDIPQNASEADLDIKNIYGAAIPQLANAIDEFYTLIEANLSRRDLRFLDEMYEKTGYYKMLDAALENSLPCTIIGVLAKMTNLANEIVEESWLTGKLFDKSLKTINTAVKDLKDNICKKRS